MGVAVVLNPQDSLKQSFKAACPNRQKKPRSPPRNQTSRSPPVAPPIPPPRATVVGQVRRIRKRGDEIPKNTSGSVVKKPDLGSTRRIGPDPSMIPSQIRVSGRKSKAASFYAGSVTMTSPNPSDVPLPAFFTAKKSVSLVKATDATSDIIRMPRLDIA